MCVQNAGGFQLFLPPHLHLPAMLSYLSAIGGLCVGLPIVAYAIFRLLLAKGLTRTCTCLRRGAEAPPQTKLSLWGSHKTVVVSGLSFHYVESSGDTSKPLLLLLHGFPESWYSWRWWLVAFAHSHRVVAVDQRGYGESDAPSTSWWGAHHYTVRQLTNDMVGLVGALGHERASVGAHDWGAVVGWSLAGLLDSQGRLDKLIIITGPHLGSYFAQAGVAQYLKSLYIAIFNAPWLPEAWLKAGEGTFIDYMFLGKGMGVRRRGKPLSLTKEDVEVFKWGVGRPGRLTAALNWYRALARGSPADFEALAPKPGRALKAPCLVLWGVDDGALGVELIKDTQSYTTRLTTVMIEGCSHWGQQDAVEEVLEASAKFLGVKVDTKALHAKAAGI